jgi:hypothetical protein
MDFKRQALADTAQRGVIGHGFGGCKAEEFAQRQGIAAAPADAALRVDALKIADQKHAEIAARRDRFAAELFGVERSTQVFDVAVKAALAQDFLQPLIKDMPLALGKLIIRKSHAALLFLAPAKTHDNLRKNINLLFSFPIMP